MARVRFRQYHQLIAGILVGVATDSARKVKSELVMQQYDSSLDDFYGSGGGKPPPS